jgi:hypothetical protein
VPAPLWGLDCSAAAAYSHAVIVYALVSAESEEAIAVFVRLGNAERMLAEALADEPGWRDVLRIEELEFPVASN